MSKAQGLAGNLSELTLGWIKKEYGNFLMDGESVVTGFELIRDCVIFTDKRIISIDRRGMLGKKLRVTSVYMAQVVGVALETAGAGINDHKLRICYITSLYSKVPTGAKTAELRYEFPKKYDPSQLYRWLQKVALENYENLNK